ncbi:acetoacetate--CoA ligase [Mycolicibacterium sp.]|uniref:acetoacetate--CoA ligase n=1 Tax=Mycolicibacterium sp. TaxID=2320850 RepID=UPI003D13C2DD
MTAGEILWRPTSETIAQSQAGAYLRWLDDTGRGHFTGYPALWSWSVTAPGEFWRSIWDHFGIVGDGDTGTAFVGDTMPDIAWFPDTRLNYAENALRGPDDDLVVIGLSQTREPVTLTRAQLRDAVARAAHGLRELGVAQGDRVVAYLPNIAETLVAMLATASLGALWAVCAPEMGVRSVLDRLGPLEPTVLIAADGYRYGGKDIDRGTEVAEIRSGLPTLRASVWLPYLGDRPAPAGMSGWSDLVADAAEPAYLRVPFDHPLWVVFSSGTTGLPKAIMHSHGGVVLELAKTLALHVDLGPADRFFVYCTTSWVMWNIEVSALIVGAAVVLFDGNPEYPAADALWRIVADHAVTVFGCGAAFIAAFRRAGQRPGDAWDLSRLHGMVVTGSPLPADGFRWVYDAVKADLLLQSTSGGTDVCTSFVGGTPLLPVRAGEITAPGLGVHAQAFDDAGAPVVGVPGELVITAPMPSMPVGFWRDPGKKRYRATYFTPYPGVWRHGDWVVFDERGGCEIRGRSDGTLNRGGVRMGTSDFYAVLDELPAVADSLVVHVEDPGGGAGTLYLFVVPADGAVLDDALRAMIVATLRAQLSPRHVPDEIVAVPAVPYNLTGKKLEVPVKRLLQGEPRGHVVADGALRNPEALAAFEALAPRREECTADA